MSYDAVLTELAAVRSALADEDLDGLDAALDRLSDAYDDVRPDERRRLARLEVAKTEADLAPDQYDVVNEYRRRNVAAYLARSGLLAAGDMLLYDPESVPASDLREKVGELIERERTLADATDAAADLAEGVTLPPRLAVIEFAAAETSPALGDPVALELVVENVGDEPVTGAEATVTASAFGAEQTRAVGTLEPAARTRLAFEVAATDGGDVRIEAALTSENAGSVSETETVTVRTKAAIVRQALETVAETRDRVTEEAGGRNTARSITSKLDAAHSSLERALDEVDRGRNEQANNAIGTATNQLGALLNALADGSAASDGSAGNGRNGNDEGGESSGNGTAVPPSLRRTVRNQAELTIEHLADARDIDKQT